MRSAFPLMILAAIACVDCLAAAPAPTSRPADETIDWLLGQSTTAPATRPAADAHPAAAAQQNPESRIGSILLSNGETIRGRLSTTREKPIRIWDEQAKEYRDVPFTLIKSMQAKVLWERDEKEWHFKESGSDIKVYSGRTYPARELQYTVTLINDQTITGGIVAPIHLAAGEKTLTFVLNKRQKGNVGTTLKDLLYIQRLELQQAPPPDK